MLNLIKKFEKKFPSIFYLVIVLILFIFINKISKNFLDQTKLETRELPEYLELVYGKENVKDYQKVIEEQTIPFNYKPFTEFGEIERLGKFNIVGKLGNRCNFNDVNKCKEPLGGEKEIWLFGGSTTFGYGLKNDETISAHLQNLLNDNFNVINFGSGYYYSTQERILLNNLLTKKKAPFAAVFIDGYNDFYKDYDYYETAITQSIKYKMQKSSSDDLKEYFKERFDRLNLVRLLRQIFFKKENYSMKQSTDSKINIQDEDVKKGVNILLNNQKTIQGISEIHNIKLLQILQPVPIYEDSYDTSNVPSNYFVNKLDDINTLKFKLSYELYLKKKPKNVLDLSRLKINDPMYIDGAHYSSKFSLEIAKKIKEYLFKKI